MVEIAPEQRFEHQELAGMHVDGLSIGKHKNHPELNEDGLVVTPHTFVVIDGSAPRLPIKFTGKSSAQFATDVLKEVFATTPPSLNGSELIAVITNKLNEAIDKIGAREIVSQTPEAMPAALFTVARINGDKIIITALGDVNCRVNGQMVHENRILTEDIMIGKRIAAMKNAKLQNSDISDEELRLIGKVAIEEDLRTQVIEYFNNPDDPLGLGIINGGDVPDKFISTYTFNVSDVHTLEIFSDGYYVLPEDAEITSWEKVFLAAEKEDPLRWNKYPAVKASTPEQFSDDRTILIAKAK